MKKNTRSKIVNFRLLDSEYERLMEVYKTDKNIHSISECARQMVIAACERHEAAQASSEGVQDVSQKLRMIDRQINHMETTINLLLDRLDRTNTANALQATASYRS